MLAVTYATATVIGYPVYSLLECWKLQQWWHYSIGGLAIGAVPIVITVAPAELFGSEASLSIHVSIAICMAIGSVSATVFWCLARGRTHETQSGQAQTQTTLEGRE